MLYAPYFRFLWVCLLGVTPLLCQCTKKAAETEATSQKAKLRVGLVLDKGGKDDRSFNASGYEGAKRAEKELGIELKTVECSDDAAIEPSLRTFAQRKYDVVIAIGFVMGEGLKKVAAKFPQTKFAGIDTRAQATNIRSILFKEHEGSFLVGAAAALKTKTGKIGFIGGMDIPLIRRFELGYRAGAKYIHPTIQVTTNYVGSTMDAWKNPMKGKELALSQYRSGSDVVFGPAGATVMGIFDAAEEMNHFAIGVDSNQNWVKPGKILTSMVKRVDKGVYDTIQSVLNGTFEGGEVQLGLNEEGVGFALDEHNRSLLTDSMLTKLESIKKDIISGKIQVPDYYVTQSMGKLGQ